MRELLQAQVRSIGEHYVVARLTALSLIVGLAPENTRAVDIVAMSEDGKSECEGTGSAGTGTKGVLSL